MSKILNNITFAYGSLVREYPRAMTVATLAAPMAGFIAGAILL